MLPTFAVVLGYSPYWLRDPDSGITWTKVVHGEHGLHRCTSRSRRRARCIGQDRVSSRSIDKGEGKGALVYSERKIIDKASGDLLATLTQTTFCRADGGFGGPQRETPPPHAIARARAGHASAICRRGRKWR